MDMTSSKDQNPFDDLEDLLESFKDKYDGEVEVQTDFQQPAADSQPHREENWEFDFDYTPREIKAHLDRFVIGQGEAKKHLANAVCYHYRRYPSHEPYYQKKNILMVGNTGVGKTHLVEVLSNYIEVPFVKADATKFSGTGYVGKNVNSLVRELAEKADYNLAKAEHGIVFLDEIDKICSSEELDRDVSGRDVQTNLLKLLEETEVSLVDPANPASMMKGMRNVFGSDSQGEETINTGNILFIVSGAFPGLEEIVNDRLNKGSVGFTSELENKRNLELLRQCEPVDLMDFGLEAEFVGRLPVQTFLDDLDGEDLYRIMRESESSILQQYKEDFDTYGVSLEFTDEALREIAERALDQKMGARGLTSVLEKTVGEAMYELPGRAVEELTVTPEIVQAPREKINRLILDQELDEKLHEEFNRHGLEVKLTDSGREALVELACERDVTPVELFEERFEAIHHILKMIERDELVIDDEFIRHSQDKLDELCSEYFNESSG